eukprot:CAMPEP_0201702578 /NCGR_PEP_ID=MMETSP0578-20130828/36826_1 /ASSEMBLY_ACC=CAM_ASM_000663 /TAXON_ID=267565 /ORGANISM="Skeletonema grethea, Strain CCMP 1804" /LENGTH=87 /DNA_ID=CAMNT_0048190165 /DNA_START=93 /DNA_END=353 /DNA_ORIENTATION=+
MRGFATEVEGEGFLVGVCVPSSDSFETDLVGLARPLLLLPTVAINDIFMEDTNAIRNAFSHAEVRHFPSTQLSSSVHPISGSDLLIC